mmetsp:Transcript_17323/g.42332  ORF Transcript_17323/g.42332 Transcript_17323/m.42332 type:complete len:84 (-) Transcript_17323:553-804(-)
MTSSRASRLTVNKPLSKLSSPSLLSTPHRNRDITRELINNVMEGFWLDFGPPAFNVIHRQEFVGFFQNGTAKQTILFDLVDAK